MSFPAMPKEAVQVGNALAARHWRVWEWFNGKIDRLLSRREVHRPQSLRDLWRAVQSEELADGDYLELRASRGSETTWFLQEWVPKAPGQVWIQEQFLEVDPLEIRDSLDFLAKGPNSDRFRYYREFAHWERQYRSSASRGKSLQEQGFGDRLGCYRPSLMDSEDRYAVLGLTTACEAIADLGFPVLVSRQVYRSFLEARSRENAVELEGVVRFKEIRLSDEFGSYLKAVGAQHDDAMHELISSNIGLRSCCAELVSPLDVTFRVSDTHPMITLRVDGKNTTSYPRVDDVLLASRSCVVSFSPDAGIDRAVRFLLSEDYQFLTKLAPLTDFDARIRRFSTPISIAENPKDQPESLNRLRLSV